MNGIEKGRGRKLGWLLAGPRAPKALGCHRVHGHSAARHDDGIRLVMSGVDNHVEGRYAIRVRLVSSGNLLAAR